MEAFAHLGPGVADLLAWMGAPDAKRFAVVQGAPGIGKSMLVRALGNALGLEIVWASCSGVGALFGADLTRVAESARTVDGKRKLIVFDEFEALGAADIAGLGKAPKTPCLFVAHTARGLPRGAPVFKLTTPSNAAVTKLLVASGADKHRAKAVAEAAEGDVRVAFDMLASGITTRVRDEPEGLDLARRVLRGRPPGGHDFLDPTAVSAVFENYPKAVRGLDALARVADGYSVADTLGDLETHDVCLRQAALECPSYGDAVVDVTKFGTLWSQASLAHAKRKGLVRSTHQAPDTQAAVRCLILQHTARGDYDAAAHCAIGAGLVDSASVLHVMRLWKTKYTLTVHSKVKARMPV